MEAFRRENESKLQPIRLQEEELSDELARQKERDLLRKNYIEEMKVRTPQNKNPSLLQVLQLRHEQTKAAEDLWAKPDYSQRYQVLAILP